MFRSDAGVAHRLRPFAGRGAGPVEPLRGPDAEATAQTVADVIEVGYILGERLVRPAKVAVAVPAE